MPRVAAVQAARERLARDLDQLDVEVRAQMAQTAEKLAWKVAVTAAAVVAGVVVRIGLTAGWRAARKIDPPDNPARPDTDWAEAIAWTMATGIGVAIARLLAQRGAAAGWQRARGELPPGLERRA